MLYLDTWFLYILKLPFTTIFFQKQAWKKKIFNEIRAY